MTNQTKERSAYQHQMDEVHLPAQKAQETLRMMLKENRALNEKKSRLPLSLRVALPILAAAACLVLLLTQPWKSTVPFGSVRISQLTVSESDMHRSGSAQAGTWMDRLKDWEVTILQYPEQSTEGDLRMELKKETKALSATVTDTMPPLYELLRDTDLGNGLNVRLNRDPDTGILYAVYRSDGQYLTLSSSRMSEREFISAVREVITP